MNKLKNVFYAIFGLSFIYLLINILFRTISTNVNVNKLLLIGISFLTIIIWFAIYKIIVYISNNKRINKNKKEFFIIGSIIFLVLFIVIEIIVIKNYEIPYGWDFEYIVKQSYDYATKHIMPVHSSIPWYFQHYPNNMFMYLTEIIVFKVTIALDITKPFEFIEYINALVIILSIVFTYLYLFKQYGKKIAGYSLIIFLFFIPLYLYTPIVYSDTISIVFMPLILWLSTFLESDNKWKKIISIILIGLFTFVGCKIKMTVVFITLSIVIAGILKKKFKTTSILSISVVGIYVISSIIFNYIAFGNDRFHIQYNGYGSIPYTHWIMMGIDPSSSTEPRAVVGGYKGEDVIFSETQENSEVAKQKNIEEIQNRIHDYGFVGYMNYLTNKAVNCWGDGTYYSNIVMHWADKYNQDERLKFFTGTDKTRIMLYFMSSVQFAMLIIVCISFVRGLIKNDDKLLVPLMTISMMLLFMLMWENRSRYLYNFIPIFVIIISVGISSISLKKEKMLKSKNKKVGGHHENKRK